MSNWKDEHEKIYGRIEDQKVSPDRPPTKPSSPAPVVHPAGSFRVLMVTKEVHELIQDLEQAWMKMNAAMSKEEVEAAYENLSHRRRDLYDHIEQAERCTAWPRTVTLRFD